MLSYRHAFHAGNHADILKHTVLSLILQHMKEKPKPFTVFDTHAGSGRYRLDDDRLVKTGEAESGIRKLLAAPGADHPDPIGTYIGLCTAYAAAGLYPGSPEISRCMLRPSDRLVLSELHSTEITILRKNMALPVLLEPSPVRTVRPQIHYRDGYEMLKALTPPAGGRGVAFIDPSYEESDDYRVAGEAISAIRKKWPEGIIALWYPLLDHRKSEIAGMRRIITAAAQSGSERAEVLDVKLLVRPAGSHRETTLEESAGSPVPRLYGSGMIVLNPPWKLNENLAEAVPYLAGILAPGLNDSWSVSVT